MRDPWIANAKKFELPGRKPGWRIGDARVRIRLMRSRTVVFAFFAAAMLFSVVREWSAPIACPRLEMSAHLQRR
jgi:hypothetical protein